MRESAPIALGGPSLARSAARAGRDDARTAAEQFVAVALVEPVLKQLRESATAPPPWGPGPGEKPFRALADAELAERIVSGSRWPLVDRLAREMRERLGPAGDAL